MKGGMKAQGYTIVEIMIVLAVSSMMFVIAAGFVSGRQARTSFNQGTNTLAANIQSLIEAVTDGQYTDIPLNCSVGASSPRVLTFSSGAKQGQSQNCTFLGSTIQFRQGSSSTNYNQFYLAGAKNGTSATSPVVQSIHDSAITPITANFGAIDLTKTQPIPQGLTSYAMQVTYLDDGTGANVQDTTGFNFGVVQSQGISDTSGISNFASGAQSLQLIFTKALETSDDKATNLSEQSTYVASQAIICLTDGTRKSEIIVGANGNALKATPKFSGLDAPC